MSARKTVSVIIPCWNEQENLVACVRSWARQKNVGARLEIIVADNGSKDLGLQFLKGARVTLTQVYGVDIRIVFADKVANAYHARNEGAKVATGDILVFTDADCEAKDPNVLATLVGHTTSEGAAIGGVKYYDKNSPFWTGYFAKSRTRFGKRTGIVAVGREKFFELGMFSEAKNSASDTEFLEQLPCVYVEGADVLHAYTAQEFLRSLLLWGTGLSRGLFQDVVILITSVFDLALAVATMPLILLTVQGGPDKLAYLLLRPLAAVEQVVFNFGRVLGALKIIVR